MLAIVPGAVRGMTSVILDSLHATIAFDLPQMTVRTVLKMGDPRLLRVARPVTAFDTQELHQLLTDLLDTMQAANALGWPRPRSASIWRWSYLAWSA